MVSLSLLVLTRNEERIAERNLRLIHRYLERLGIIDGFELIICDHSDDGTPRICRRLARELPETRYVDVKRRGIGAGLKAGIDSAKKEYAMFYPIDLSWPLDTIYDSIEAIGRGNDIVIGSRFCKGSEADRPMIRNMFSHAYNRIISMLFPIKVRDTQGTVIFDIGKVREYRDKLESDGPFLQTEILVYADRANLKMTEIPCRVRDRREDSSINPAIVGLEMLFRLLLKRVKMIFEN